MTYTYLKKGRMRDRPYHLIGADGVTAVCGALRTGDEGVLTVAMAPNPVSEGLVCEKCQARAAVTAVQRLAEGSPFRG